METHPTEKNRVGRAMKHLQPQHAKQLHLQTTSTRVRIEDDLNQGLLDKSKMKASINLSSASNINLVGSYFNQRQKREFVPLRMNLEDIFYILKAKGDLKQLQPKFRNLA